MIYDSSEKSLLLYEEREIDKIANLQGGITWIGMTTSHQTKTRDKAPQRKPSKRKYHVYKYTCQIYSDRVTVS